MPDPLLPLVRAIAAGDREAFSRILQARPDLARAAAQAGATRASAKPFFFTSISHYLYAGDTALHIAAAAHRPDLSRALLERGASVETRNRRGAQPLHYACDGGACLDARQAETVELLLAAGADPDAPDKSGTAPLHRAVRTRCAAAVQALLKGGANPRLKNDSGSTPLHLAVQTTGRGGSGEPQARELQRAIVALLLKAGASPKDRDGAGKTAAERCRDGSLLMAR